MMTQCNVDHILCWENGVEVSISDTSTLSEVWMSSFRSSQSIQERVWVLKIDNADSTTILYSFTFIAIQDSIQDNVNITFA